MTKRLTKTERKVMAAEQIKAMEAYFATLKVTADATGKPVEIDVTKV